MKNNEKKRSKAEAAICFLLSLLTVIMSSTFLPRLAQKSASRSHKKSKMKYLDR